MLKLAAACVLVAMGGPAADRGAPPGPVSAGVVWQPAGQPANPAQSRRPGHEKDAGKDQPPAAPKPGKLGAEGYRVSNALIDPIQDGTQGARLEVKDRRVIHGTATLDPETVRKARQADANLRIEKFKITEGTTMIQLDVGAASKLTLLGKGAAAYMSDPILLNSADEQTFEPVGYWYEDDRKVMVRYTPDRPIRSQQELAKDGVMITRSRSDQQLYLLFTPSFGVELTRVTIGKNVLHRFEKPVKMDVKQDR